MRCQIDPPPEKLPSKSSALLGLIVSNEEMDDIMKIVKSLEDYGLLIKRVNETIKNKAKEQICGFLRMFPMDTSSSIHH